MFIILKFTLRYFAQKAEGTKYESMAKELMFNN
jgi:hypothetical protein